MKVVCDVYAFSIPRYAVMPFFVLYFGAVQPPIELI